MPSSNTGIILVAMLNATALSHWCNYVADRLHVFVLQLECIPGTRKFEEVEIITCSNCIPHAQKQIPPSPVISSPVIKCLHSPGAVYINAYIALVPVSVNA